MSRLMDEILAEVDKETRMENASRLLKHDIPIETIAKGCGLSIDEVIELKSTLNKT